MLSAIALVFGASVASANTATVFVADDEYQGGGQQRVFESHNATFSLTGDADGVRLQVSGGSVGDAYTMRFAPPAGEALARGVYTGAVDAAQPRPGRPGIAVVGPGLGGCIFAPFGDFEVKDIALDGAGAVTRLWIVYSQGCGVGGPKRVFGEVRVGQPETGARLEAVPTVLRWPEVDAGISRTTMPVTLRASRPGAVGSVSIDGSGAGAYAVRLDECAGKVLAQGAGCRVWVQFAPASAGTHRALLRVADAAAPGIALEGFAYGGRTRLLVASEPGEFIGQGHPWSFTTDDAIFSARRSAYSAAPNDVQITVDGQTTWNGIFTPSPGEVLTPGHYDEIFNVPWGESPVRLRVSGDHRECNFMRGDFTVNGARYDQDGAPLEFAADFNQECLTADSEGNLYTDGVLSGTFEFRVGDTTPRPPWLIAGATTESPGPPQQSAPVAPNAPAQNAPRRAVARVRPQIRRGTLRASASGHVRLRLRCPAGSQRCRGTVALVDRGGHTLGRKGYDLRGGAGTTVAIRLHRAARRRLGRGPLPVRLRVREGAAALLVRGVMLRRSTR